MNDLTKIIAAVSSGAEARTLPLGGLGPGLPISFILISLLK